jgi:serine/threonine-protein kinase
MSPESFSSSKDIDHRTDIFSLGSLSYEILTGQRPFEADTVFGVMEMIRNYLPPKPSSINREIKPWMDMLVMWMLEKKSDARPFDCAEIIKIFHNQTINN